MQRQINMEYFRKQAIIDMRFITDLLCNGRSAEILERGQSSHNIEGMAARSDRLELNLAAYLCPDDRMTG